MQDFLPVPKGLFTDEFSDLPPTAKLLFALLLDRNRLSKKNRWSDELGETYFYYTIETIVRQLGVSKGTAIKLLQSLERANLISREKQGAGKPDRIKTLRFNSDENEGHTKNEGRNRLKSKKSRANDSMITYDIKEIEELFNRPLSE